jgi:phytoene synthase
MSLEEDIFKKGSTTYYFSSKFFPKLVREDVFRLYSFVRVADDYVDSMPQQTSQFKKLRSMWRSAASNETFNTQSEVKDSIDERVVKNIVHVQRKYGFEPDWIEAFLDSMQADLNHKQYKTLRDSLWYVYGSAEVIGLMMAKILGLPEESYEAAKLQGRAMQWINFIRDIDEDIRLGRCYFPKSALQKYGLGDLSKKTAMQNQTSFNEFMRDEIERYRNWQFQANEGYTYIPKRLRIPLETARDMYNWTAEAIYKNPFLVFEKKIKPKKTHVLRTAANNSLKNNHKVL